jgi:hypothetical protein
MLTTETTEQESKAWYQRAWNLLGDYRQKQFTATISHGRKKTYTCIELYSSALSMDKIVDYIKSLLAGKGFTVDANKNTETITIK